ncbi:ParB/RepB/Spo0J family partition protein [Limibaculum sp. FT325]|uniref:ParB/RepB/Spo0J family partition protein n=1 Tax=Thermohalobaculum sediminis TaxID=2939436 RepID=UPI0020BD65F7|nr:ParB/RepB/Spo0J family partition protein [Limibaculum sediminis]MCL5776657.1 ParB/RepB/Spo0J family partition protein [Limibaculum sediminis]
MKKPDRKSLGRGLSALLGDIEAAEVPVGPQDTAPRGGGAAEPGTVETGSMAERAVTSAPIERIHPNPDQPRRDFREEDLAELAASIRERGIIQPVIVRPHPARPGEFQIVAGERRWRAAQRAQLHRLPVVVRDFDDRTVLEVAVIENVQRADLNPVEEAQGYSQLLDRYGHTQDELARIVGKSRSHLANILRLLALPPEVLDLLRKGELSAGHARALINAPDPVGLARRAVAAGLTVRDVEKLVREASAAPRRARPRTGRAAGEKDADTRLLEGDLSAATGMRVTIEHVGDGSGEVRIRYRDLDDLDRLCQRLTG